LWSVLALESDEDIKWPSWPFDATIKQAQTLRSFYLLSLAACLVPKEN